MDLNVNEIVDTVTVDAQKRFYSLATVVGAAVTGSLVTAAAFTAAKVVERHKAKKALESTVEDADIKVTKIK